MGTDFSFLTSTRYKLTLAWVTALFFFLFLLVFLPFGVNNYDPDHHYTGEFLLAIFSNGLCTGVVIVVNEFALARLLPAPRRWPALLAWWLWIAVSVGAANFLVYNWWGSWHDLRWASLLEFVLNCATILVFPLLGCFIHFRHRAMRARFESALSQERQAADPDQLLRFAGTGSADHIALRVGDFLHARAQDNYVELRYRVGDGAQTHLLRATLASLSEACAGTGIVRCHRSYLVNLRRVVAVRGSASRLQLVTDVDGEAVPVSRSFAEATLAALRELGVTEAS